jgi:signal transduction histidine kinase
MRRIIDQFTFVFFLIFLVGVFSSIPKWVAAQDNYSHQVYDENGSLKNTYMNDVAIDKNGLVWISNSEYLLIFDGRTFKEYPYTFDADTAFLPYVRYFFDLPSGEIGFATRNYYYRVNENFKLERLNSVDYPEFTFFNKQTSRVKNSDLKNINDVSFILQKLVTLGNQDYYVTRDSIWVKNLRTKKAKTIDYFDTELNRGVFSFGNRLFCKTLDKMLSYENGQRVNSDVKIFYGTKILPINQYCKVFQVKNRNYFINESGVYSLSILQDKLEARLILPKEELPLEPYNCSFTISDDERLVILATKLNGLHIYRKNLIRLYQPEKRFPFSFNNLVQIEEKLIPNTAQNFYWDTNGVSHEVKIPFFTPYNIVPYVESKEKQIIVSELGELYFYNYNFKLINRIKLPDSNILFRYIKNPSGKLLGFGNKYNVIIDSLGFQKIGLPTVLNLAKKDFLIYDICFTGDTIWFANYLGLYALSYSNNKLIKVFLPDKSIRRLVRIGNGNDFFILTYGSGIYLFKDGKIYPVKLDEKKLLLHAHSLIFDQFGIVWIPTNRGIVCTHFTTWYKSIFDNTIHPFFYNFGESDGLNSIEMNGGGTNSFVQLKPSGKVFLSSIKGLITFNPNEKIIKFPSSPIAIISTSADNKVVFGLPDLIYSNRNVELTINCPYWGNQDNLKIEYLFDSKENSWQVVNSEMKILLARPSDGSHELKLRYRSGFGENDYYYTTFTLNFKPFWFETFYFRTFVLFSILGLIILIIKMRTTYLIKEKKKLEQIIEDKTTEIRQAFIELSNSEKNLIESNLIRKKLVNVLAHDIRSPLKAILFLSNYVKDKLNESKYEDLDEPIHMVSEVSNSVQSIFDLASDFLVWYNLSQDDNFEFEVDSFELNEALDSTIKIYGPLINTKGNKLILNVEKVNIKGDRSIYAIILRNLIDNANKYTLDGNIKIETLCDNDGTSLVLSNWPVEMNKEKVNEIHTKINLKSIEPHGNKMNLGLGLVSFLASKINLNIQFSYLESKIVVFTLRFVK